MNNDDEFEIALPQEELDLLSSLVISGTGEVKVSVRYEPDTTIDITNGSTGRLIIHSLGGS